MTNQPISPSASSGSPSRLESSVAFGFNTGDPEDPRNFAVWRKWAIVAVLIPLDLSVSWGATAYSPAISELTKEFDVSAEVGTLGLSLYIAGLAIGPMMLAPLSEHYGRTPLYVIPYAMFLLFLVGTALVQNIGGFLALRAVSGCVAGVTIANFGGTIADLWLQPEIGPAMSLFLWAAVCGGPSGYFLFAFVAQTEGWRIVFWALLGVCGGLWLLVCLVLIPFHNETRHSSLLRRRAKRLLEERGLDKTQIPENLRKTSLLQLFRVTLTRPFRFLFLEPIVIFAALYNGYLYGLSYLFTTAYGLVFGSKGAGFDTIGVGLTFLGQIIGVSLGVIVNIWQERYYQRRLREVSGSFHGAQSETDGTEPEPFRNLPEARVQLGKLAAVTLPVSLFWFAWTCQPQYHIHWIVPVLATALFGFSFYCLILMSYLYIVDSYLLFAASALAGVGLTRNVAGAGFPLFGTQMFENEGYNWAVTILAFLSCLLMPIPFILERYGPQLRAKSPYARQHSDLVDG